MTCFQSKPFRLKAEATSRRRDGGSTREAWTAEADVKAWRPLGIRGFAFRRKIRKQQNVKDERYRPGRTLVPTFWTPIVISDAGETVVGAATAMSDALGRHAYARRRGMVGCAHAARLAAPPTPTTAGVRRCSPAIPTTPIRSSGGTVRSRELFAGALLPFRQLRWTETLLAGFDAQIDTLSCRTISANAAHRTAGATSGRFAAGGWHDSRRLFGVLDQS